MANTTENALGHRHRQQVEQLFQELPPIGHPKNPCDWCGRPRHKDRTKNWDYNPNSRSTTSGKLQGDHSEISRAEAKRRRIPVPLADRLLHAECNRQRGDGSNDHLAANPTQNPSAANQPALLMTWPQ